MKRSCAVFVGAVGALALVAGWGGPAAAQSQVQIYGTWHCGDDYCTWSSVREMADFDAKNRWIIDRGDGVPSVNLVVLSFVNPLRLLNKTNDAVTVDGVPVGMTHEIVDYFRSHGVRVAISIGGFTYTDDWTTALGADATQLGLNAAELAQRLGVGIEIDYEQNTDPDLVGLQAFIDAYRSVLPFDPTGRNHAARLTLDFAAGDRYLQDLTRVATEDWLTHENPVLDYANAMVPARQPSSAARAIENWQEHVDGKPQYAPPILPLAPSKFAVSLYLVDRNPIPECDDFPNSLQYDTREWVRTVAPNGAGATPGVLGYMFWASECSNDRNACTTPPDSCESGMGVASQFFDIPVPIPPLREALPAGALYAVDRAGGGALRLGWADADGEDAFEIYRGELRSPFVYAHDTAVACGLAANTTTWVSLDDQETGQPSYYYLVVPRTGDERDWGLDGAGVERPPSAVLCP